MRFLRSLFILGLLAGCSDSSADFAGDGSATLPDSAGEGAEPLEGGPPDGGSDDGPVGGSDGASEFGPSILDDVSCADPPARGVDLQSWDDTILGFEMGDEQSPPELGSVVFTGSSSIVF